jgi:RNA polymerase sigma factor (sigma-70 family)
LLALAGDERLADQLQRGNELAFEVAFERHGAGILAFCRHMLGSREEAEDAVQHTFAAAYRDLQRSRERSIQLKAWLYTIARNRCVSVLRARREQAAELHDIPTDGLSEQVEQRAELRELLGDVRELPEEQRAALLLSEAAGLSHAEVAKVLGCEVASVKGIVFRARSSLIERRAARHTPCSEIREQLANLRGGALRRNELRHHLRACPGCSAYREEVRRQRKMLAAALPVVPSFALKSSVMGAAGITGGAAAGASAGGGLALGSAALAKVAVVGVIAGGSVVAGEVAVERAEQNDGAVHVAPAADRVRDAVPPPLVAPRPESVRTSGTHGEQVSGARSHGQRGAERSAARSHRHGGNNTKSPAGQGNRSSDGGRRLGQEKRAARTIAEPRGNGAPGGKPKAVKPVTQPKPVPQRQATPKPTVPVEPVAPTVQVPEAVPAPAPKATPPGQLKNGK